jgi:hypothetical protein
MSTTRNGPEGSEQKGHDTPSRAVFKSSEVAVQRLNDATNSVVSEVAVSRGIEEVPSGVWVEETVLAASRPNISPAEEPEQAPPGRSPDDAVAELDASMAKVEETVQSIEQRRAQIEETYQKAEAMLAEAQRISAALQVGDALRERIEATVARTRGLRSTLRK